MRLPSHFGWCTVFSFQSLLEHLSVVHAGALSAAELVHLANTVECVELVFQCSRPVSCSTSNSGCTSRESKVSSSSAAMVSSPPPTRCRLERLEILTAPQLPSNVLTWLRKDDIVSSVGWGVKLGVCETCMLDRLAGAHAAPPHMLLRASRRLGVGDRVVVTNESQFAEFGRVGVVEDEDELAFQVLFPPSKRMWCVRTLRQSAYHDCRPLPQARNSACSAAAQATMHLRHVV